MLRRYVNKLIPDLHDLYYLQSVALKLNSFFCLEYKQNCMFTNFMPLEASKDFELVSIFNLDINHLSRLFKIKSPQQSLASK